MGIDFFKADLEFFLDALPFIYMEDCAELVYNYYFFIYMKNWRITVLTSVFLDKIYK